MSDPLTGEDQPQDQPKSAPADRQTAGPFDAAEANLVRPYVDLGSIKIVPREGLSLRVEVEEATKRVVAIGLEFGGSTLQLQAFAAPRTAGLWHEIREQLAAQIEKQGGTVQGEYGPFGPELRAELPVAAEGAAGLRAVRFVGVDGPRWFLRGVIAGEALTNPLATKQIEEIFRNTVVVRGATPMPPRELLPLQVPAAPGARSV